MDAADHVAAAATATDLAAVVVVEEEGRVGTMDIALEAEAQVSVIAAVSMDIWPGIVNGKEVVAAAAVVAAVAIIVVVMGTLPETAQVAVLEGVVEVVIRVGSMGTSKEIVQQEVLVEAAAEAEGVVLRGLEEVVVAVAATTVGCKGILLENALTTHEKSE